MRHRPGAKARPVVNSNATSNQEGHPNSFFSHCFSHFSPTLQVTNSLPNMGKMRVGKAWLLSAVKCRNRAREEENRLPQPAVAIARPGGGRKIIASRQKTQDREGGGGGRGEREKRSQNTQTPASRQADETRSRMVENGSNVNQIR
jgi:hypothetical protein